MSTVRACTLVATLAAACATPDPATALRDDLQALRSEVGDLRVEVAELRSDVPDLVRAPERDRLRVIHDGRATMPAEPGEPLQITLDPETSSLLTQPDAAGRGPLARAIPHHDHAGQRDGYRLSGIARGSLLHAVGLRSGDVVHAIDARPCQSPEEMNRLSDALASRRPVAIDLTRRGVRHTLTIEHPPNPE